MSRKPTAVIVLNGPPRSGKDSIALQISNVFDVLKLPLARALKERTHGLFGHSELPWDYFEDCKDTPHAFFHNMTPRQAYIWVSEEVMKPKFGLTYWAEQWYLEARRFLEPRSDGTYEYDAIVVPDGGFDYEVQWLVDQLFGRIAIYRVYRDGCTFEGDSRSYLYDIFHSHYAERSGARDPYLVTGDINNSADIGYAASKPINDLHKYFKGIYLPDPA